MVIYLPRILEPFTNRVSQLGVVIELLSKPKVGVAEERRVE
jgi:hypothetical protein